MIRQLTVFVTELQGKQDAKCQSHSNLNTALLLSSEEELKKIYLIYTIMSNVHSKWKKCLKKNSTRLKTLRIHVISYAYINCFVLVLKSSSCNRSNGLSCMMRVKTTITNFNVSTIQKNLSALFSLDSNYFRSTGMAFSNATVKETKYFAILKGWHFILVSLQVGIVWLIF